MFLQPTSVCINCGAHPVATIRSFPTGPSSCYHTLLSHWPIQLLPYAPLPLAHPVATIRSCPTGPSSCYHTLLSHLCCSWYVHLTNHLQLELTFTVHKAVSVSVCLNRVMLNQPEGQFYFTVQNWVMCL